MFPFEAEVVTDFYHLIRINQLIAPFRKSYYEVMHLHLMHSETQVLCYKMIIKIQTLTLNTEAWKMLIMLMLMNLEHLRAWAVGPEIKKHILYFDEPRRSFNI